MEKNDLLVRDLKRFDDSSVTFERTALLLGFVCFFLAVWVRTPALQINPASAVGLSISGFNVGHAIVFGPIVTAVTAAIYLSLVNRRETLRSLVRTAAAGSDNALSPGDLYALDNFQRKDARWIDFLADRLWKSFWYFAVPPLAALICLLRYCDFVPSEAAKAGGFWNRVGFLFFDTDSWFLRPILPTRALEGENNLMAELPYIYGPWQSWIELILVVITTILCWRAGRVYFCSQTNGVKPVRGPSGSE